MGAREDPGLQVVRVFCAPDGTHGNPLGVFLDGPAYPAADRQAIAHELGFSETTFVDDPATGEMRIFTPQAELDLAGHPLVGTAWCLREAGHDVTALRPPAGEVGVRFDAGEPYVSAPAEWSPPWEFEQLPTPADVDALDPGDQEHEQARWAWIDEAAGIVRVRTFARDDGIPEDEATGSAAMMLTGMLGREIEIRQGRGSVIRGRPTEGGRVEVGGMVVLDPQAEGHEQV